MSAEAIESKVREQALRESESKYRYLFENMIDGFAYHKMLFDDHGKPVDYMYLEVNDAFEKMTGLKKEDVVGKRVTELIPGIKHEQAGWIEKYGRVTLTGEPIKFENYSEALRRWFSVTAYSPGKPYFATVFEDITARKQAEAEASAHQMRLAEALEAADMVTWEWDIPTRSIRYSNNIQTIVRGEAVEPYCSLDALMPQIHPEDREGLAQALDQTSKEGTPFQCEYRVHMLDGTYRWILGKGKRVVMEDGKPVRVLGLSMDITERKQKEERLRQSEAKFRILADDTYDMEFWIDPEGRYVFASPSSKRITGYDPQEFIENPQLRRNIVYPEDLPLFDNHLHEEEKAIPQEIDYRIIRADGSVRWISHGCRRIFDEEGHFLGIRGSNRDVTARKQVEGTIKADLAALTRMHTLSGRLLEQGGLQPLLEEVMDSAVAIMGAEKGTLQLLEKGSLRIVAHHGHQQPFLAFFSAAENVASVCGETTRRGERVIVPDVEASPLFVGTPSLEVLREAGVRAVQSTPMISRTGTLVGILTTQWGVPYNPNEHDLWRVDLLVRQAVELIEYSRAEEELRVSEARRKVAEAVEAERKLFYEVLETLPAYVILLTPDYHATFANRTFRERFGESQGLRCFELLFGRSEPCETCETYSVLKTMAPHAWEWRGPDGRDYSVFDYPFTDVDGSTLILEMGIDVTERKRAEEALRDASRYTRSLIEASLDPLVTISAEGKIMDVNRATEQITGISRDELIGTDFLDYFTEPEKAREGYQKVFREGLVKDYPLAIRHTSGRVIDVLYNAAVYKNEAGDVQGVFAAARDVTDLKQKESQIRFFASQCLTAQETERRRIAAELHDSIVASLAAAKFRVEAIAPKINQGGGSLEPMNGIASTIGEIIMEIRRLMTDLRPSILDDLGVIPAITWLCREFQQTYSHIFVEKQIGAEEHEVPDSLKTPIFRIAQEALNNVAKHSKASLVNLLLQKEGEGILLSVQDNGQGFDPEAVKKGMGLSNIRERAELSGGAFDLETAVGKGTIIRASWPLASLQ